MHQLSVDVATIITTIIITTIISIIMTITIMMIMSRQGCTNCQWTGLLADLESSITGKSHHNDYHDHDPHDHDHHDHDDEHHHYNYHEDHLNQL